MNHLEIWKKTKEKIKASEPLHAYSTWFDPIRAIGLSNGELVLEVPNQFFFEWIQSHYKETIKNEVEAVYKEQITIKYTISPEGRKKKIDTSAHEETLDRSRQYNNNRNKQ